MVPIKHFGVFQFKDGVSESQVDLCFHEMKSLVGKVPGLLEVLHGSYMGSEGLNDGFSHGFIMTFESVEALEAYLPHPEHERVKEVVLPCLERVLVFDFII
jgi:hypothetical protein